MHRLEAPAVGRAVFTRAEALAVGWTDRALRTQLARGRLVRVSRGSYVPGETWQAAHAVERHRLRALGLALDRRLVLYGPSAATMHGFSLLTPPRRLYVLRPDRVRHGELVTLQDVRLTSPDRTVLDCAACLGVEVAWRSRTVRCVPVWRVSTVCAQRWMRACAAQVDATPSQSSLRGRSCPDRTRVVVPVPTRRARPAAA